MSLSTHLADRHSPVRRFVEDAFPIIDSSKTGSPLASELQGLLGLSNLPKVPTIPSGAPASERSLVGIALDYRIRYYFARFDLDDTVAAGGASVLSQERSSACRRAAKAWASFADAHAQLLDRVQPEKKRLNSVDERDVARHCVLLAQYEQLFRAGPQIRSPLLTLEPKAGAPELLARILEACVDDVCALSHAFEEDARPLFELPAVLNPNFRGSHDIGGADADLILGQTLFEIKTLTRLKMNDLREAMYQLLTYALLDYDDRYEIRSIAVYLTRHRDIWTLPLWCFLLPPATLVMRLTRNDSPSDDEVVGLLQQRREEFRACLRAGEAQTTRTSG
jgi:hypothetical protein